MLIGLVVLMIGGQHMAFVAMLEEQKADCGLSMLKRNKEQCVCA